MKSFIGNVEVGVKTKLSQVMLALREETEVETTECKRITPVDTSALVNSVHTVGPSHEGNKIKTSIVAGGVTAPYAVPVHEVMDVDHSKSKNSNGQAKFIETPLFQSRPYLGQRIARRVKRNG